jgi:hypothetical protein
MKALREVAPDLLPSLLELDPDVAGSWVFHTDEIILEQALRQFAAVYQEKGVLDVQLGKVVEPSNSYGAQQFVVVFWRQSRSDPRVTDRQVEANLYISSVPGGVRLIAPPCILTAGSFVRSLIDWCKQQWEPPIIQHNLTSPANTTQVVHSSEQGLGRTMKLPTLRLPIRSDIPDWFVRRLPRFFQQQSCLNDIRPLYNGDVLQFFVKRWSDARQIELPVCEIEIEQMPDNTIEMRVNQFSLDVLNLEFMINLYQWVAQTHGIDVRSELGEFVQIWQSELWFIEYTDESAAADPKIQRIKQAIDTHKHEFLQGVENTTASLPSTQASLSNDVNPGQIRRRGGRKTATTDQKRAIVEGWLAVQTYERQDVYCANAGISTSTLRRWARELGYNIR